MKVWKLPATSGYANLNTGTFDRDGVYWFTGQSGIYGRLDPRSGEIKVWKAPGRPGAYGIAATPEGDIYYASLAGNHIAKIDKATGAATVIEPPTKAQGARRVWSEFQGQNMGIRMERGAAQVFMTPNEQLARMEIARRSAEGIRCLCRRSRHCLGVGLGCQCDCVVRSYNRSLPKLSLLRGLGERAPDPRTVGRGLAAGIGPGPPRGDRTAPAEH